MAVPKRKTSKYRKRIRRSHHAMKVPGKSTCKQCGQPNLPHAVCDNCGHYKGEAILKKD
ncbi:MAG: 50S ribosomal protein L32 [Planctomycetes bacterium]|nr:50S ribosomal protein L32 [Planctomycetota bacterium]